MKNKLGHPDAAHYVNEGLGWLTESYLSLCTQPEVAEKLRELWEPKAGDWLCDADDGNRLAILSHKTDGLWCRAYWFYAKRVLYTNIEDLIWLPRIDQLIDLLEERGWVWRLESDPDATDQDTGERCRSYKCNAAVWDAVLSDSKSMDDRDFVDPLTAPDPASALLKALVEVMKDEQKKVP